MASRPRLRARCWSWRLGPMLEIVAGIIGLFWLVEAIFSMTYRKPKPALRDQRRRAERHEYTAERFGLKMAVTEYKDPS